MRRNGKQAVTKLLGTNNRFFRTQKNYLHYYFIHVQNVSLLLWCSFINNITIIILTIIFFIITIFVIRIFLIRIFVVRIFVVIIIRTGRSFTPSSKIDQNRYEWFRQLVVLLANSTKPCLPDWWQCKKTISDMSIVSTRFQYWLFSVPDSPLIIGFGVHFNNNDSGHLWIDK